MKNAAVDVLLPQAQAMTIYTRWVQRDYQARGEQVVHGQDLYGYSYAVKVDEINGLFVMPMPTNAPAPQQALPGNFHGPQRAVDRSGTFVR